MALALRNPQRLICHKTEKRLPICPPTCHALSTGAVEYTADSEVLVLEIRKIWSAPSWLLLPGSLRLRVLVPVSYGLNRTNE